MADMTPQERIAQAREALAYNIENLRQLEKDAQEAREAHERAAGLVNSAEGRMNALHEMERALQKFRSAKMEQWAKRGGDMPDFAEARDLVLALEGRHEAEEFLSAAKAAEARMAGNLASADLAVAEARRTVDHCAIEILKATAEAIALEIEAKDKAVKEARLTLAALVGMPLPGGGNLRFGPGMPVYEALYRPRTIAQPDSAFIPYAEARAAQGRAWHQWREALQSDPKASFSAPAIPEGAIAERQQLFG